MKTLFFATLLASASVLPAQQVIMVATNSGSSSGSTCDPFSCTPRPLTATRGTNLGLTFAGAPGQPHILLAGIAPSQCVVVPGIADSWIVQPSVIFPLQLTWGRFYASGATLCASWMGVASIPIARTLPGGLRVLLQAVAPVGSQWTFSNAVDVTLR